MVSKKVIEVEGESEKVLTAICDEMLKLAGFPAHPLVSKLVSLVKVVEYKDPTEEIKPDVPK